MTLTTLTRAVSGPNEAVLMAVGWLAREGKVEVAQEKRSIYLWLAES